MLISRFALAAALLAAPVTAQQVADVGLMMDGGVLTVIYGQSCGPFTCQPFQAGPTGAGQPYNVYIFGAPLQFFALAADFPTGAACLPFPGVGNSLLLLNQPVTLAIGAIGAGSFTSVCQQGRATYQLTFPLGTPPGVQFLLQGVAISATQNIPAFTVAIASVTG